MIRFKPEKLVSLLTSCKQISEVVQIHGYMIKDGFDTVPFYLSKLLASAIIDVDYAAKIFDEIERPNLFMFNTMIRGYSNKEKPKQALFLFNSLRSQGLLLDQFSYIWALKACVQEIEIGFWMGLGIHGLMVKSGFEFFINVRNTLLHSYCGCKRIHDAQKLFDEIPERDLVSWNTLMGGYLKISHPIGVINLFKQINFDVSSTTVLTVLSACADLRNLDECEALHCYCIKRMFCSELKVVTEIIVMYSKNGYMDLARKVFDGVSHKDIVLWNCMIQGYAGNGFLEESLCLLRQMIGCRMKPNSSTLAGVLKTCASTGALSTGKKIHSYIDEEIINLDEVLGTALVDMYSKCGALEKAVNVFEQIKKKDVKSWTAMITGYGVNGEGESGIRVFEKMEGMGVMPNEVTFLAVLNACSHGGLVSEGKYFLDRMTRVYGFSPGIEHYGCVIDMLGRAGLIEEAYELIKSLPIERDSVAWRALLAACKIYGNIELGETVRRVLMELNDEHPSDSILLSGSYASQGRWDDIARIREEPSMKKEAGWSNINQND
ncbi:hypothetical protein ACHQM5_006204 [Ranunculus cassubicifolius]